MNRYDALSTLDLPDGASASEVERVYEELYNDFQLRIQNAPTPKLRERFEERLSDVETAYALLRGEARGEEDLPASAPVEVTDGGRHGPSSSPPPEPAAPANAALVFRAQEACQVRIDGGEVLILHEGEVRRVDVAPGSHLIEGETEDGRLSEAVARVTAGEQEVVTVVFEPAPAPTHVPVDEPPADPPAEPEESDEAADRDDGRNRESDRPASPDSRRRSGLGMAAVVLVIFASGGTYYALQSTGGSDAETPLVAMATEPATDAPEKEDEETEPEEDETKQAEASAQEQQRLAAQTQEAQRQAEEQLRAEEQRKAEEERRAEEQRRLEAERRVQQQRLDQQRKAEEQRRLEAERKAEEERRRIAEQRRIEEQRRAEEQRRQEEQRLAASKRNAEVDAFNAAVNETRGPVYQYYAYMRYLRRYPNGQYAAQARQQMAQLIN